MKRITDSLVEEILVQLSGDAGESIETHLIELQKEQALIVDYINQDSFDLLTDKERDTLFFITIVIWLSMKKIGLVEQVPAKVIEYWEEYNWELANDNQGQDFRSKLDVFFKGYEEEEILALIEDTLTPEEEEDLMISDEGRMFVFVALKTITDSCLESI